MTQQDRSGTVLAGTKRKTKKRRARPNTPPLERGDCKRFLEALALGHPVAVCALKADLAVSWLYVLADQHEDFRKAWDMAYVAGSDFLEDEARRRGLEGTLRPVFHNGKEVGTIREYSDACLFFTLKCRNRAKYEGMPAVKVVTPGGDPTAAPGEIPRDVPLVSVVLQSPTTFERPPEPTK